MNTHNLAIVFGPTLFQTDGQDYKAGRVVEDLISHYVVVFSVRSLAGGQQRAAFSLTGDSDRLSLSLPSRICHRLKRRTTVWLCPGADLEPQKWGVLGECGWAPPRSGAPPVAVVALSQPEMRLLQHALPVLDSRWFPFLPSGEQSPPESCGLLLPHSPPDTALELHPGPGVGPAFGDPWLFF